MPVNRVGILTGGGCLKLNGIVRAITRSSTI